MSKETTDTHKESERERHKLNYSEHSKKKLNKDFGRKDGLEKLYSA
jgi:hypothetical protein